MYNRWFPYRITHNINKLINQHYIHRRALRNAKQCYVLSAKKVGNKFKFCPLKAKYVPDYNSSSSPWAIDVDAFVANPNHIPYWGKSRKYNIYKQKDKNYYAKFGISSFVELGRSEELLDFGIGCGFVWSTTWSGVCRIAKDFRVALRIAHSLNTPSTIST